MGLKSWSLWEQASAGHKEGQHAEAQVALPVPPTVALPGEAPDCASVQMCSVVTDNLFHSFGNLLSSCVEWALMPCKLCSLSDLGALFTLWCVVVRVHIHPVLSALLVGWVPCFFLLKCSPKQ